MHIRHPPVKSYVYVGDDVPCRHMVHSGMTLQELIAQVTVEFFSREGRRKSDKASTNQLLHCTVCTLLTVLRNRPSDQSSTSERMRWAKERRTSKKKASYSAYLLKILHISIPITYSKRKSRSGKRLQAETEVDVCAPSIIPSLTQ